MRRNGSSDATSFVVHNVPHKYLHVGSNRGIKSRRIFCLIKQITTLSILNNGSKALYTHNLNVN